MKAFAAWRDYRCWLALFSVLLIAPRYACAGLALSRSSSFDVSTPDSGAGSDGAGLQPGRDVTSNLGGFNIVINPGAGLAGNIVALAAFNRAAAQWKSFISDPITVNINANLAPLGSGIIGSTSSVVLADSYTVIRNAMVLDAADETEDGIVAFLPTVATASFYLPDGFGLDGDVQLTKANAKALGFTGLDGMFGAADGAITFSSNFSFDFDKSNGISPGQMDFETVAVHEIGHLLGFISDVDYIDDKMSDNLTANNVEPTTLDLFRFQDGVGNDPESNLEFSLYPRSMVPGTDEFFDQVSGANGGAPEVLLSTGLTQGDGRQASHWKDLLGLGVMDPTLAYGEISNITGNDMRALDLIGYDLVIVPEAGAWLFGSVAACAGGVGYVVRRRSA